VDFANPAAASVELSENEPDLSDYVAQLENNRRRNAQPKMGMASIVFDDSEGRQFPTAAPWVRRNARGQEKGTINGEAVEPGTVPNVYQCEVASVETDGGKASYTVYPLHPVTKARQTNGDGETIMVTGVRSPDDSVTYSAGDKVLAALPLVSEVAGAEPYTANGTVIENSGGGGADFVPHSHQTLVSGFFPFWNG